jgi:peptide/nickel transport system permease protein
MRASWTSYAAGGVVGVVMVAAVAAPWLAPYPPTDMGSDLLVPPSLGHLFGTDDLGRDIFSRVIYGASVSVLVGVISMGTAAILGVPLGLLSGYRGGWVDTAIMRVLDGLMAFPAILLAIAIMAVLGPSLQNAMIAIGVIYIPPFARIVRASVLSLREQEFVDAARGLGAVNARIVFRHILPNCLSPVIVQASLGMGYAILVEAALSFLGLGVQPPQASWGSMLAEGRGFLDSAPWFATFPGLAIFVTVLGLNFLGDRLREALDPRLRQL